MLPKIKRIVIGMKSEKKSACRLRRNIFKEATVSVYVQYIGANRGVGGRSV